MKTASTLPNFTPSHGHTYLPPAPKSTDAGQLGLQTQTSKENTPMPDDATNKTQSFTGSQADASSSVSDMMTLAESFNLLARYGDEFMDETPLVGEPGSFILSRAGDTDRGATSKQQQLPSTAAPGRIGTPQTKADTPGKSSDKGSTVEEPKRKKKSKPGS